jgi:fermentation-respiration switch protein FrsA (DUF1100 family)
MARLMYVALLTLVVALGALAVFVRWLEPRFAFYPTRGEAETPRDFGIPFEAITIDTADGEHLRGWVMRAAVPRAQVVYFHGNGANLSNWSPILANIVAHGYSVLAIDYRGYGMSTGRPTERGLYRDVDAIVKRGWPTGDPSVPTIYWGRSLGATMAAYAATVRPPDGLILESGFTSARAAVRGSMPLVILSLLSSYRFPTAEFVNRASRPVLVMHGNRDAVIPFDRGRDLFEKIAVPKQFVVIEGGDHNDTAPPRPEDYWGAIDRFVATLRRSLP